MKKNKEDFIVYEWLKFFGEQFFLESWTNDTKRVCEQIIGMNEWKKIWMKEWTKLLWSENFNFQDNLLKKLSVYLYV